MNRRLIPAIVIAGGLFIGALIVAWGLQPSAANQELGGKFKTMTIEWIDGRHETSSLTDFSFQIATHKDYLIIYTVKDGQDITDNTSRSLIPLSSVRRITRIGG